MAHCTDDIRRKLNTDNVIDHKIELQIIVAVLLENKIDKYSDIYSHFTNYFNELWNLQFIDKTENKKKNRNVLTYICWKFGTIETVDDNVITEILNISKFYLTNRPTVRRYLKSLKQYSKDLIEIEKSLFHFLKDDFRKPEPILIVDFIIKSKEVEKKYSKSHNIDHFIEIQILKCVLSKKQVGSDDLKLKFIKYFHQDWNFQILTKDENHSKCKNVKNWIKFVNKNSESCSDQIYGSMKLIFNHYKKNISTLKKDIEKDTTINKTDKGKIIELVDNLNELFENNIPL